MLLAEHGGADLEFFRMFFDGFEDFLACLKPCLITIRSMQAESATRIGGTLVHSAII